MARRPHEATVPDSLTVRVRASWGQESCRDAIVHIVPVHPMQNGRTRRLEADRFDALAETFSLPGTRRGALGTLLGGALGVLGLTQESAGKRRRSETSIEGPCGNGSVQQNRCKRHAHCCTGYCHNRRRCRCKRGGEPCTEERNCCPDKQGLTCLKRHLSDHPDLATLATTTLRPDHLCGAGRTLRQHRRRLRRHARVRELRVWEHLLRWRLLPSEAAA